MRFNASYDEHKNDLELGGNNDLQVLIEDLQERSVNVYHCFITEYDYTETDAYGCPEIIAQTRLIGILDEEEHTGKKILDLTEFIIY